MRMLSLVARLSDGIQVAKLQPVWCGYRVGQLEIPHRKELVCLVAGQDLDQRLSVESAETKGNRLHALDINPVRQLDCSTMPLRRQSLVVLTRLLQAGVDREGVSQRKMLELHRNELLKQIQQFQADLQLACQTATGDHSGVQSRLDMLMQQYRELYVEREKALGVNHSEQQGSGLRASQAELRCETAGSLLTVLTRVISQWEGFEGQLDCVCGEQLQELKQLVRHWESRTGRNGAENGRLQYVRRDSAWFDQRFQELNLEIAAVRNQLARLPQGSISQPDRQKAIEIKVMQLVTELQEVEGLIAKAEMASRSPLESANQLFSRLTEGEYPCAEVDPDDARVMVRDCDGHELEAGLVSETVFNKLLLSRLVTCARLVPDQWWAVALPAWPFLSGFELDSTGESHPRILLLESDASVSVPQHNSVYFNANHANAIDPLMQPLEWTETGVAEFADVLSDSHESTPECVGISSIADAYGFVGPVMADAIRVEEKCEDSELQSDEEVASSVEGEEMDCNAERESNLQVLFDDLLDNIPDAAREIVEATGCSTIEQFLQTAPETLLSEAQANGDYEHLSHVDFVRLQRQVAFLSCIEGLDWDDTDLLLECGIYDIETFADLRPVTMQQIIRHHIANGRAPRHYQRANRYTKQRLDDWNESAIEGRQRWRMMRNRSSSLYRQREALHNEADWIERDSEQKRMPGRTVTKQRQTHSEQSATQDASTRSNRRSRRQKARHRRERQERSESSRHSLRTQSSQLSDLASQSSEGKTLRFFLSRRDAIVDAPNIGPKTARLFERAGIKTIDNLLNGDAAEIARSVKQPRFNEEVIRQLQQQCRLQCQIPELRGHDAQILVGCEIDSPNALQRFTPEQLLKLVEPFVNSKEGERIVRGGRKPDLAEVTDWIEWSKSARGMSAA